MARPSRSKRTSSSISACVPTSRCTRPPASVGEQLAPRGGRRGTGQQPRAEPRPLRRAASTVSKCCSARISVGAISATWRPFSMRDERRDERDDRLARADVALQQPVHLPRLLHVLDDLLQRDALAGGERERQQSPGPPHARGRPRPARTASPPAPASRLRRLHAELEQEELLEDQPQLRRACGTRPSESSGVPAGGKCASSSAVAPVGQAQALARSSRGQQILDVWRQALPSTSWTRAALHARRQRPGLLVDRHDAAGVDRVRAPRRPPPRRRDSAAAARRESATTAPWRTTR